MQVIHDFDPAIVQTPIGATYWYGAVYTVGFLGVFFWFRLRRQSLGLSLSDIHVLTIMVAVGILIGGRAFDILVYELGYYRENPLAALNWWNGGMASHGVLLGTFVAVYVFSRRNRLSLVTLLDEIVVPGAFLLAVGRLGNFIEGGVIGSQTDLPWGFVYPNVEGARHPVALYESLKNLIIVPVLIIALRIWPSGRGIVLSLFVTLYAGLRFIVDLLRDYEAAWLGIGTGQVFNLAMALAGMILLVWFAKNPRETTSRRAAQDVRPGWVVRLFLIAVIVYPLGIPTSWTKVNIEVKRIENSQNPDLDQN